MKTLSLIILILILPALCLANMHTPAKDITYDNSDLPSAGGDVQSAIDYIATHGSGGISGVNWGEIGGTITNQNWESLVPFLNYGAVNWPSMNTFVNGTNIGIGTTPYQSLLSINGGGVQAELVNKGYELIIPSPTGLLGPSNSIEVSGVVTHKGKLYINYADLGGKIFSWDGNVLVNVGSISLPSQTTIVPLGEYQGNLFAGSQNGVTQNATVYESTNDGTTWTSVFSPSGQFFIYSFQVFNGNFYAGAGYSSGKIYQFNGSTWTQVYNGAAGGLVGDMYVYKGRLFAALQNGSNAIISSADGVNWKVEMTGHPCFRLMEFRGHLYASTIGGSPQGVYQRNDATGTWSIIATISGISQCDAMGVMNNSLYVGCTSNSSGAVIYKSYDGVNFSLDFTVPFGSGGSAPTEAFRMINYDGSLYTGLGFSSNKTGDIWRKSDSLGQQTDWTNTFINKFRPNTNNLYNWSNDYSLIEVTSPWNFDSIVRFLGGVNWIDLTGQITSSAINWNDVNTAGPINGTGINWSNFPVSGFMKFNGSSSPTADTNTYLTANQLITLSGDISGSGATSIAATLPTVNSNIGTFQGITVNGKGLVTAASNQSYLTGNQTITASGDATGSGTTSLPLTLGTVNSNTGSFTNANITVNGKGLITAASNGSGGGSNYWSLGNVGINTTSNVGIGSVNPGQNLDVIGTIRATNFSGSGSGLTGTASSLTANTVTTNANLTGAVTSTGNITSNNFIANIGIGSANPGQALDVKGTVRAINFIGSASGLTGLPTGTQWGTVNTTDVSLTGGNVGIGTNLTTTSALTVMNGNVGIGTWVPAFNLDLENNSANNLNTININTGNTGESRFRVNAGTTATIIYGVNLTGSTDGNGLATSAFGLASASALPFVVANNNVERMRINTSGNLGIGTTNPGGGLVVMNGNVGIGTWNPGSRGILELQQQTNTNSSGLGIVSAGATGSIRYWVDATGNARIDGGSGASTIVSLNGAGPGNVGIGTFTTLDLVSIGSSTVTNTIDIAQRTLLGYDGTNNRAFLEGNSGKSLVLQTNGTNIALTIDTNQNVGIGSLTPSGRLDVESTTSPVIFGGVSAGSTFKNVGIGSYNPGQILDVQGTVRSSLGFTSGSNCFYYCNGGTDVGLLSRGSGCLCPGGSCVATNICSN